MTAVGHVDFVGRSFCARSLVESMAELGCLALPGRLVQEKALKATSSADPERCLSKALRDDVKHNSASLFAKRELEPAPGKNRHVPACTS